jgi:hypothetical protein
MYDRFPALTVTYNKAIASRNRLQVSSFGVIHIFIVSENEASGRPFPTAVQIMTRRRFFNHIHLRLVHEGPKQYSHLLL